MDVRNVQLGAAETNANVSHSVYSKRPDYSQLDLSHADLSGIMLVLVNLDKINLSHTDLTGADLRGSSLQEANLSGVNLSGAKLSGAYLRSAKMCRCNLSELDLSEVNLSGADLSGVNFNHGNLNGANLMDALCYDTSLIQANLNNANFSGAKLNQANLSRANLKGADLSRADLTGARYSCDRKGANLTLADLSAANLSEANLSEANLIRANLKGANLGKAALSFTNMAGANLIGAVLSEAEISSANVRGAKLDEVTAPEKWQLVWQIVNHGVMGQDLSDADLSGTDLSDANLSNTNLTRANLSNANLSRANFSQANLSHANLSNAKLYETTFTDANLEGVDFTDAQPLPRGVAEFSNTPNTSSVELLNQIREASEGLSHISEYNHPYEAFLWATSIQGKFSLEGLLKASGLLQELSADAFCTHSLDTLEWIQPLANKIRGLREDQAKAELRGNQEVIGAFRRLLDQLAAYLTNIQVLWLTDSEVGTYSSLDFYIVLGNTPSGDWLGISTRGSDLLEQSYYSSQVFRVKDLAVAKPENQALIEALESAITGVHFSPYLEHLKDFVWEVAEQRSALIHNLLDTIKALIADEAEMVFRAYEDGDEDDKDRASQANRLVMENLSHLRVYRLGAGEIDVYFVGQTENGDWIGFRTKSVET